VSSPAIGNRVIRFAASLAKPPGYIAPHLLRGGCVALERARCVSARSNRLLLLSIIRERRESDDGRRCLAISVKRHVAIKRDARHNYSPHVYISGINAIVPATLSKHQLFIVAAVSEQVTHKRNSELQIKSGSSVLLDNMQMHASPRRPHPRRYTRGEFIIGVFRRAMQPRRP